MAAGSTIRSRLERRKEWAFTLLSIAYVLVIAFPILWMALMMFKAEDIMFERPTGLAVQAHA